MIAPCVTRNLLRGSAAWGYCPRRTACSSTVARTWLASSKVWTNPDACTASTRGAHLHITHAPDELRDAKAFKPLWRVPKSGFGHRTEQVLPRRFKGNAWPVRRTDIGALLQR